MAEADQYNFPYKEIVEALVKKQGLHEGLWALRVEFGLSAINVRTIEGSTDGMPAAIIPVVKIGIQRATELNNLSVDAAVVNPKPLVRSASTKAVASEARKPAAPLTRKKSPQ
jgi:hypothetical protein